MHKEATHCVGAIQDITRMWLHNLLKRGHNLNIGVSLYCMKGGEAVIISKTIGCVMAIQDKVQGNEQE